MSGNAEPPMFCQTCGYALNGLESPCPECGHAFDPTDPATFSLTPRRRRDLPLYIIAVAAAWPSMWYVWMLLMLCVARLVLGQWPNRGGLHDPKHIAYVGGMYPIAVLLLLGVPISLAALFMAFPFRPKGTRRATLFAGLAIWGVGLVTMMRDPAEVGVWFID